MEIKQNKGMLFAFAAGMVVIGVVWYVSSGVRTYTSTSSYDSYNYSATKDAAVSPTFNLVGSANTGKIVGNSQERTITNNYLSAHVKEVESFHAYLVSTVKGMGGKVMSQNITIADDSQSSNGIMTVLVPNKEAESFFADIKGKVIKIVDQRVTSYQITQEYTDIERQLARYESTYEKIMTYYAKAKSVNDLMSLQSQLDQVQTSIDSLKGRKRSLDELSSNTQYTIYSSTNEYNLPYVPEGTFEIAKTFKVAVRSLVAFADDVVKVLVYVLVFTPVIALGGGIFWAVKKYMVKKQ